MVLFFIIYLDWIIRICVAYIFIIKYIVFFDFLSHIGLIDNLQSIYWITSCFFAYGKI